MFERFTERARQVIVLAQEEARGLKHGYIGTEHLLLGLLREEQGVAAQALDGLGVKIEEVRARVAQIVGERDEVTSGQIPFTPRSKKVLELGLRESLALGHRHVAPEHILLGLVSEGEGVAARILSDLHADAARIREAIEALLSGYSVNQYEWKWRVLARTVDRAEAEREAVEPVLGLTIQQLLDGIGSAQSAAIADRDVEWAFELANRELRVIAALALPARVLPKIEPGFPRPD